MPQLFGHEYSKRQLLDRVGDMSQVAGVRKAELVEGSERGADLIEVFNASGLSFSILPGVRWMWPLPTTRVCRSAFAAIQAMWGRLFTNRRVMAGCAASTVDWCSPVACRLPATQK